MKVSMILLLVLLHSCSQEESSAKYDVISKVFYEMAVPIEFSYPTGPNAKNISKEDSIRIQNKINRFNSIENNKKFIVVVEPNFSNSELMNLKRSQFSEQDSDMIEKIHSLKSEEPVEIDKISIKKSRFNNHFIS